jgi:hypothetical protein
VAIERWAALFIKSYSSLMESHWIKAKDSVTGVVNKEWGEVMGI